MEEQACANASNPSGGKQGRGDDHCVWARQHQPVDDLIQNMSCQHSYDIPCLEKGAAYQTNATLCNAVKGYGHSCRVSLPSDLAVPAHTYSQHSDGCCVCTVHA